jgi:hypothetical protein
VLLIYPKEVELKKITYLTVIFSLSIFSSCATKIPFEQTCLTCVQSQRLNCKGNDCPETIMAGTNCIASIDETGEKIYMNHILQEENIAIQKGIPLTLAKIRGRYFVIGKNFKNLWMLTPVENKAKAKKIALPEENLALPPIFELSDGNLLLKGPKNEYLYIYDIDNKKWIKSSQKAGA